MKKTDAEILYWSLVKEGVEAIFCFLGKEVIRKIGSTVVILPITISSTIILLCSTLKVLAIRQTI